MTKGERREKKRRKRYEMKKSGMSVRLLNQIILEKSRNARR